MASLQQIFRSSLFGISCLATRTTWLNQKEDFFVHKNTPDYVVFRALEELVLSVMRRTESLTEKELNRLFVRGLKAWMGILDEETTIIDDDTKLQLYGLYKQAKTGSAPDAFTEEDDNAINRAKWEAWRRFTDLDQNQAKKTFLVMLTEVDPEWQD